MALTFQMLGGAGTVTGSKCLVEWSGGRVLVDCGLFQGIKELRLRNWAQLPLDPRTLDAVILTHAHLDHSGYLPVLVKAGFRGPIFATSPTKELCRILLADAAHIQEEDAEYSNRKGFTKHKPALPLFNVSDAERAMEKFRVAGAHSWHDLGRNGRFRLYPSGHILGSVIVELDLDGKKLVFSGDLGRAEPLTLHPPEVPKEADFLWVESTYGDRVHDPVPPSAQLAQVVQDTVERGGTLLIPSFAVGRTQDVLLLLSELKKERRIADIPVYLDSPMGIQATQIFLDNPHWHRLTEDQVRAMESVASRVSSREESKGLLRLKHPSIIIAGSGMMAGGRILHHLETRLPDARNTVLLVGFQAAGTRGRLLQGGIRELKMHGRYVPVGASVKEITGLSAHADQAEILQWLGRFAKKPERTFLIHGEPQAADALRVRIKDALGWRAEAPAHGEKMTLEAD